jgi:4-amino-4-deoxy-L-arabinose transferase-like glycosyltransferase
MKKLNLVLSVPILLFLTLMARLLAFYFFADNQLENEWMYLVHNLSEKGVLGINIVIDKNLALPMLAQKENIVLPSVFMPPLYSYIIYVIKFSVSNFTNYINVILFLQIILSTITIYIFFKIIRMSESFKFSIISAYIFSFIPINIYSSVQISSISIQVFLIVYLFYVIKKFFLKKKSFNQLIIFSFLSAMLILLRGEFILFYFFTLVYLFIFFSRKINFIFISLVITSLLLSPYILRNYINFNSFILTKSFGYNLLKGNNPEFKVEGNPEYIEKQFNRKDLNFEANNLYEIKLDDFYKDKSLEYIKDNKTSFVLNYLKKFFSFLFIDINSSYSNYYNVLHILPKIILSIASILGGIILFRKKGFFQYLSFYFFSNILFFSIFFILPRYSLILMPIQILLSIEFVKLLLRKFSN